MDYVFSLNYDYCAKHDRLVNPKFGCRDCLDAARRQYGRSITEEMLENLDKLNDATKAE